jgi:hypothetical protein
VSLTLRCWPSHASSPLVPADCHACTRAPPTATSPLPPGPQLATEFRLRSAEVVDRIQTLEAQGALTGVMDERGKFIHISSEEMAAVAEFVRKRGRIAIAELAARSCEWWCCPTGLGRPVYVCVRAAAGTVGSWSTTTTASPERFFPSAGFTPSPPPPPGELIDLEPRAAVTASGADSGEPLLDFDAMLGEGGGAESAVKAPIAAH